MGSCMFTCSRNALISLNVIYMLVAVLLVSIAGYARVVLLISSFAIIGSIIGCGVFLCLLGLMGLCGAIKHHQVCLFFYMVILFLLFLVQFSLAIALLAISKDTQKDLAQDAWNIAENGTKVAFMNRVRCCGFEEAENCQMLSCCSTDEDSLCCGNGDLIHCPCSTCKSKVAEYSDYAFKITGGVSLFISFTEVIGVLLALRFRNQKDPLADPNAYL